MWRAGVQADRFCAGPAGRDHADRYPMSTPALDAARHRALNETTVSLFRRRHR